MSNKVFRNRQGIIECHVVGAQDVKSITQMGQEIKKLLAEPKAEGQPRLVLDDITHIGKVPSPGRRLVSSLAKTLPYDRLAMYGTNGVLRFGANLIIRASGRGRRLKYFTDRRKAIDWLLEFK